MVSIGITGSRHGASNSQLLELIKILEQLTGDVTLHHGDCVGVDEEAAIIATELRFKTVAHPPTCNSLRAYHNSNTIMPAKDYIARNHDIVDSCDILIAIPAGPEKVRSGTWATIRYAKKCSKEVKILQ